VFASLFLGIPEDSTVRDAVQRLEALASGTIEPQPPTEERAQAVVWTTLWHVAHGDLRGVDAARRYLTTVDRPWRFAGWVGLIDVVRAQAEGGDVRAAALRLDSIVRGLPLPRMGDPIAAEVQNLLLARMLAQIGDPQRALAAIRRRPTFSVFLCSTYWSAPEYLREEARLAATVGDAAGAIRAYQHYLALRENPDPPWRASWDSARAELAALVAR
jgi:hypothetical protein